MNDLERFDLILQQASLLYEQLPFWKRWRVARYYKSNNWDVTHVWTQCLKQAEMMIDLAVAEIKPTPISSLKTKGE